MKSARSPRVIPSALTHRQYCFDRITGGGFPRGRMPMQMKRAQSPVQTIVGTLSLMQSVMQAWGLKKHAA